MAWIRSTLRILLVCVVVISSFLEIYAVAIAKTNVYIENDSRSPPSPVSWQSAFWTLLPLALNAMTQNSTLDRDFPSGILFPARSSPIVCATDTLDVLLRFLLYTSSGVSAPHAARRIVQQRAWRPGRSDSHSMNGENATQPPPLTFGSQYPVAHTIIFTLGVLPQAVKLFGMQNIPWTQVCGGAYLFSFLLLAGVGALARRVVDDDSHTSREGAERMGWVLHCGAVVVQMGVWVWWVWALLLWGGSFKESKWARIASAVAWAIMSICVAFVMMAVTLWLLQELHNYATTTVRMVLWIVTGVPSAFGSGTCTMYLFVHFMKDIFEFVAVLVYLPMAMVVVHHCLRCIVTPKFKTSLPIICFGLANLFCITVSGMILRERSSLPGRESWDNCCMRIVVYYSAMIELEA